MEDLLDRFYEKMGHPFKKMFNHVINEFQVKGSFYVVV